MFIHSFVHSNATVIFNDAPKCQYQIDRLQFSSCQCMYGWVVYMSINLLCNKDAHKDLCVNLLVMVRIK